MEAIGSFFKIEKDPFYIKGQQAATQSERAKADRKIAKMALELKKEGVAIDIIAKTTKLPIEEIESL